MTDLVTGTFLLQALQDTTGYFMRHAERPIFHDVASCHFIGAVASAAFRYHYRGMFVVSRS